jgi:hypothetical protein
MAEPQIAKYEYPFVECNSHPGPQRSYIICPHVHTMARPPDYVQLADDEDAGTITCYECRPDRLSDKAKVVESFRVVCQGCAVARELLIHT